MFGLTTFDWSLHLMHRYHIHEAWDSDHLVMLVNGRPVKPFQCPKVYTCVHKMFLCQLSLSAVASAEGKGNQGAVMFSNSKWEKNSLENMTPTPWSIWLGDHGLHMMTLQPRKGRGFAEGRRTHSVSALLLVWPNAMSGDSHTCIHKFE